MITLIRSLIILLIVSSVNLIAQIPDPDIQEIINRVSIDSLTKYVAELSGEEEVIIGGVTQTIVSRHKNYPGNNLASSYLKEKLESYGLMTYEQSFSATGKNIYAVKPGLVYPDQKYIICGHFDSMPNGPISPGSDDNASGTALVIEAARILKDIQTKYTVIFALWDEEEQGLIGSRFYADSASLSAENILGVLNFDMIAYDGNNDNLVEIHTRESSLSLSNKMIETNTTYGIGIVSSIVNPGITASDHASFWTRNYPAILTIENYFGDFNPRYHTTGDRIQYFDTDYYLKCSKLGLGTLATLIDVDNVTPVELISFTAAGEKNKINLYWTTSSELNNYGFEIEKRINGYDSEWITAGFIPGFGSTTNQHEYNFADELVKPGLKYFYRLKQIDFDGSVNYSSEVMSSSLPVSFELFQNYPNPFNPSTVFNWLLPDPGFVTLKVINSLGEEVETLLQESQEAGMHSFTYNVNSYQTSGIYFYRLQFGEQTFTKKMMLIK
jgi:hypothetical protein